jgi:hypothetical protein
MGWYDSNLEAISPKRLVNLLVGQVLRLNVYRLAMFPQLPNAGSLISHVSEKIVVCISNEPKRVSRVLLYLRPNDLIQVFATAIIPESPNLLVNILEMSASSQVAEGFYNPHYQCFIAGRLGRHAIAAKVSYFG